MRLIDADALIDELTQRCCNNCINRMGTKNGKRKMVYEIGDAPCLACEVNDIKVELDEAPTIEAEPIRHGKWIHTGFMEVKCNNCGNVFHELEDTNYCPHCGYKMDL